MTSVDDTHRTTYGVQFTSGGIPCAGLHVPAHDDALVSAAGRPVVILAHGLAGTVDSGLEPFAHAFAAAGLDALAFDYRGFGNSQGTPRQRVRLADQVADFHAAIDAAKELPGVDPSRVVVWGISLAGGHVLQVAGERSDIAAVISVVPMVDGLAAARHALASHRPRQLLQSTALGIRSRLMDRAGRAAVTMPVVAQPGELGALTLPGAYEDYLAIAGPSWRNEIQADVGLELGSRAPLKAAASIAAPTLVQIADFDRSAPPQAEARAAFAARAEVRHYPCDHFDLFAGKPWHEPAVRHAVGFLHRTLAVSAARR